MTTTDERAAFLRSIIAQPDCDTARLAFADFLEENGEPERAEFIRVQVELSRAFPHVAKDPDGPSGAARWKRSGEYKSLRDREAALFAAREAEWRRAGDCPECGGSGQGAYGMGECSDGIYRNHWQRCRACHGTGDRGGLMERQDGVGADPEKFHYPVTFRRGFADAVECRLDEVFEQGNAQGSLSVNESGDWRPTRWARAVVAAHPVTQFVLTDREPDGGQHVPVSYAWWLQDGDTAYAAERPTELLPYFLLDALPGSATPDWGDWRKSFPTRAAAIDALALAACKVVRGWKGEGKQ